MPKRKHQLTERLLAPEPAEESDELRPRRGHARRLKWIPKHEYNDRRREEFAPEPTPKRTLRDRLRRR